MAYNVNTDLIKGDDIFLYITSAETVIAYATSVSLQVDGETIDTSNKMSCQWNSALAGKNSYTVSADALYTNASGACSFDALLAMQIAGEAVEWEIAMVDAGKDCEGDGTFAAGELIAKGEGLITSLSLNAGNNEVASCSLTITGSGAIETA